VGMEEEKKARDKTGDSGWENKMSPCSTDPDHVIASDIEVGSPTSNINMNARSVLSISK